MDKSLVAPIVGDPAIGGFAMSSDPPAATDGSINVVTHPNVEGVDGDGEPRDVWDNKCQFMLSCIGYAVGLGNVWRFPYLCYKNGGGTFLIPYAIMLVLEGIPLFFLELSLGQHRQKGAYGSFTAISPALGGIGIASLMCSFFVGLYYTVIISWTLLYLFASFQSELPWDGYTCDNTTNGAAHGTPSCTGVATEDYWYHEAMNASDSIDTFGSLQWRLVLSLLGAWLIIGACEIKGIKTAGRVVYFTATFPYVVLVALFFRGITLEGADKGIQFYLKPDLARLGDAQIWLDAASQILYSLSPGFGTLIAFASFNKQSNNTMKDAFTVSMINCGTSVFAGFAVFSILGHMAHTRGVAVDQVVEQGPGLAFVAYPSAVLEIGGSVFWSIAFFFMMFLLGLDSMFGTVEAILTILDDMGITFQRKEMMTVTICTISFLCGLIMCCQANVYIFELFDQFSAAVPLMCIVFTELIAVSWIYGVDRFIADIELMIDRKLSRWWWYMWKWVTPLLLGFILTWNFINEMVEPRQYATAEGLRPFPPWATFFGWVLILSSVLWIPGVAIWRREHIHISRSDVIGCFSLARLRAECTPQPAGQQYTEQEGGIAKTPTLAPSGNAQDSTA